MSRRWMNKLPKTEEDLGVTYDDDEGYSRLPDGSAFGNCTNVARFVQELLKQGRVVGFQCEDNPVTSEVVGNCFGHDFLLVEERYVVDLWISLFVGDTEQMIFDLEDPEHSHAIQHYFGDPLRWVEWRAGAWVPAFKKSQKV